MKKYICKDCNAIKIKCDCCSSIVSFSGLKSHIKRVHPKTGLHRAGYFNKEAGCSCKCFFLSSKFEASGIDIDELIEISKKV